MNFIKRIANYSPALWRFVEVTVFSLVIGALISLVQGSIQYLETGEVINIVEILKTFLVGILSAIGLALSKYKRDLDKQA